MVTFFSVLSVTLMVLSPVVLGGLLIRRVRVTWGTFMLGAGAFILSQAVHLPLNHLLGEWGIMARQAVLSGPELWRTALVGGLTAGVCEEAARFGAFQLMRRRGLEDGVMLGIGHGGVESMVFGGVLTAATVGALLGLQGTDLGSLELTSEQVQSLKVQMAFLEQPWLLMFSWVERMIAMSLHVSLSVLVWKAVVKRTPLLLGAAVLYHMAVDTLAVLTAYSSLPVWQIILVLLGASLPLIIWAFTSWKSTRPERKTADPGTFWLAAGAALHKELLFQVRSKRVLIVLSVFTAAGILSPLLAKFMPEIIGSIEEARPFAELIPEPSAADSYVQYIKNITQFGFMMALLLGMGAVAGEQERGTAALILSKPMPRWIFVTSKFASQALVYLVGFAAAGVFTFGYTWILFGPQPYEPFLLINVLLVLWLLTYVGITMTGSALARTTGAAAGYGAAGMAVLLAAGGIPAVGQWAPGGLIAWADMVAAGEQAALNLGSVVMAVVLFIFSAVGAVAALERKEI